MLAGQEPVLDRNREGWRDGGKEAQPSVGETAVYLLLAGRCHDEDKHT